MGKAPCLMSGLSVRLESQTDGWIGEWMNKTWISPGPTTHTNFYHHQVLDTKAHPLGDTGMSEKQQRAQGGRRPKDCDTPEDAAPNAALQILPGTAGALKGHL